MLVEISEGTRQRVNRELDIRVEDKVIVRVAAVHHQIVGRPIADVGVTVEIIHGDLDIAEDLPRHRDNCRSACTSASVVDQHYVRGAHEPLLPRRHERRREGAQRAVEKREVRAVRDDADRQRCGSHGRK